MPSTECDSCKATELKNCGFKNWVLPAVLWIGAGIVYFRQFLFSGFDMIAGNNGDVRFDLFIRENFYQFLLGRSEFFSPPMFYPVKNTLGYSDTYLLDALIYVPMRVFGFDPYLSFEIVLIVTSLLGFCFFNLVVTRYLKATQPWAAIAGVLFVFSNGLFIKIGHPQMQEVCWTPLIVLMVLEAARRLSHKTKFTPVMGYGAGLMFALLCTTAFYVSWFFLFLAGTTLVAGSVLISGKDKQAYRQLFRHYAPLGKAVLAGFLTGAVLFLMVYGDMLLQHKARGIGEYLNTAPVLTDIINVSSNNWVWGNLFEHIHIIPHSHLDNGEIDIATSPAALISYAIAIYALRRKRWLTAPEDSNIRLYVLASAAAFAVMAVTVIKFHEHTLYFFALHLIPGANAIRDGARAWIVTNGIVTSVIAIMLTRLSRNVNSRKALLMFSAFIALLLVEQINVGRNHNVSRSEENQFLAAVPPAPETCRSFFLTPQTIRGDGSPKAVKRDDAIQQIDAIMIAQKVHVPTLNGYSGWSPQDWQMDKIKNPEYFRKVWEWANSHDLAQGLCSYDVTTATWDNTGAEKLQSHVEAAIEASSTIKPGLVISLKDGSSGTSFLADGWANPESDGTWTNGSVSTMIGLVPEWPDDDMAVQLSLHPFLVAQKHPSITVSVLANNQPVDHWTLNEATDGGTVDRTVRIPRALLKTSKVFKLEFHIDAPAVPKKLGVHPSDDRHLGLFVKQITFLEASHAAATRAAAPANIPVIKPGLSVDLKSDGNGLGFLGKGWATPEAEGVWTDGPTAALNGTIPSWPSGDMIVQMNARPFLVADKHPIIAVAVLANGQAIDHWLLHAATDSGMVLRSVRVPHSLFEGPKTIKIEFQIDAPAVPKDLGVHPTDDRHLGLFVSRLSFQEAK